MKLNTSTICALAGLALATCVAPLTATAAPCELEENKWGVLIGHCYIQDWFEEELVIQRTEIRPLPLRLPDLYADDADFRVNGTAVVVQVRTGNTGQAPSQDFDVTAQVEIRYANSGQIYATVPLTVRVNGIDVGEREWNDAGIVTLPDRVSDWDLRTRIFVDSSNMQSGGEIWEMNETNNEFDDGICRVYGENPDLSVRACN